jgi:lipopolysaccharide cholinephosphotransferase
VREIGIDEIKMLQLDVLQAVHDFCNANNIRYYLMYGTLLGAIRHKGYIPWDDDIDVAMPRKDYEKFIESFNFENIRYQLLSYENNYDFCSPFIKVVDTHTKLIEDIDVPQPSQKGINIDVFPLDAFPNREEVKATYKKILFYKNIFTLKSVRIKKGRSNIKNAILFLGKTVFHFVKPNYLVKKIDQIGRSYNDKTNNKYLGNIIWGYGTKDIVDINYFASTLIMKFEEREFKVPIGYDEILTAIYGDYMEPPPVEKRVTHHAFQAYWRE